MISDRPPRLTVGAWSRDRRPYDAPLGSESSIREWWSAPAHELGLPKLADIYERGFNTGIRWSGDELRDVATELGRLEAYWRSRDLSEVELTSLLERGTFLREALAAAELAGGIVVIT